jgi:ubiquinone/menaquinone biosynthesis C-methylase UbiE
MNEDFYDAVAQKFGIYESNAKYSQEFLEGNPEKIFKEELLMVSRTEKIALDVGCADGRFTFSVASCFRKIVAVDMSLEMLKLADQFQKEMKITNVSFEKQNAFQTSYEDSTFDLIYSRRGPTPFSEFHRLLKPNGYFVGITIGEKDCRVIKEIFGRGQGYKEWDVSRSETDQQKLKNLGFEILLAQNYFYNEYYASYEDIDLFLQSVPLFEDFDSVRDKKYLENYESKFKTEKGIKLPRHRIVFVAQKLSS